MTTIEMLCNRLRSELGIDADPLSFIRLYPGYWQRKQGAWSWSMRFKNRSGSCIGSQWTVRKLIKAEKLSEYHYNGDWYIDPLLT